MKKKAFNPKPSSQSQSILTALPMSTEMEGRGFREPALPSWLRRARNAGCRT